MFSTSSFGFLKRAAFSVFNSIFETFKANQTIESHRGRIEACKRRLFVNTVSGERRTRREHPAIDRTQFRHLFWSRFVAPRSNRFTVNFLLTPHCRGRITATTKPFMNATEIRTQNRCDRTNAGVEPKLNDAGSIRHPFTRLYPFCWYFLKFLFNMLSPVPESLLWKIRTCIVYRAACQLHAGRGRHGSVAWDLRPGALSVSERVCVCQYCGVCTR